MMALLAAAAVLLALPGVARAGVSVTNLRVGRDQAADPAATVFAPGTESVFARFDYDETSNTRIGVSVMLRGGIVGHSSQGRYSGKGSEAVEISGTGVLRNITAELVEAGGAARSNAQKAATQSFGMTEYLIQVQAGLNRVDSAVVVLDGVPPRYVDATRLKQIKAASKATHRLIERAVRAVDDPQKREIAEAMDEPLGQLVTAARALSESAQSAQNVPLPESGQEWEYVVSVSVEGSPALTTEFIVSGYRVFAPLVQK